MAWFRYTPPADAGAPDSGEVFGTFFVTNGDAAEVVDADAIRRMRRHSHFEEVVIGNGGASPEITVTSADWRDLDKAELDAYAKARGVSIDRRMSLQNMQAAFEAAMAEGA